MGVLLNQSGDGATPAEVAAALAAYHAVPIADSADNAVIADMIGVKNDTHSGTSLIARTRLLNEHVHSAQKVWRTETVPITLTSGSGSWTLGSFATVVVAGQITDDFDIHWAIISNPNTNEDYEIAFYYGDTDISCGRLCFTRSNNFVNSISVPLQTPVILANSRIRAKMADGSGDSVAKMKILYHTY